MDTAKLTIRFVSPEDQTHADSKINVYWQSDECHKCTLLPAAEIAPNTNETINVQTNFETTIQVTYRDEEACKFKYFFGESASYKFVVSSAVGNNTICSEVQEMTPDDNAFLPILFAFILFAGLAILWIITKWIIRKYKDSLQHLFSYQHLIHSDLGNPATLTNASMEQSSSLVAPAAHKPRLRSLDTFRGFSLVVMIFVNYGGGGYWFFSHSSWNGLTVADLVFPWFVWIMGVALAFSYRGPLQRGERKSRLFLKVLRRSIILFVFGFIVNTEGCTAVELSKLRIMGVLQRFAISYLVVATLEILMGKLATTMPASDGKTSNKIVRFFWDLFGSFGQWIVILLIAAAHTLITFLLPVPGCPTGYLGPGGLADNSSYYNCTGGASQYVDRIILGPDHMYDSPTCREAYKTDVPYDPEGLLGCLTSIVMCYLGLHAGRILALFPTPQSRISRWLTWSLIWGLIAGVLCGFSQHNGIIPVNKNLWSLSFILSLSSMALVLLSALYFICDVLHLWSGAPFVYPGMNSIVVYMCHELMSNVFPVTFVVDDTHLQKLAINLWGVTLWTSMAALMYYYDVFIAI